MRRALHAEWTKLWTLPGTGWLLAATIVVTVAASAVAGQSGVRLGQAVVAVLAVLMISGEYGTAMIQATLTAMPRREVILAAKALLLTGLTAIAGTAAVAGSVPITGQSPGAAAESVLYLVLIALFSLGVGTAVRDPAVSMGAVLGVPYLLWVLPAMAPNEEWGRRLLSISPMSGGLAVPAVWAVVALLGGGLLLRLRDA